MSSCPAPTGRGDGAVALLELTDVTTRIRDGHRDVVVLDRVSLQIDPGDSVGLWGPRRSGKSTLLRVLAGAQPPDEGTVRFAGVDLWRLPSRRLAEMKRTGGMALATPESQSHLDRPIVELVAEACMADGTSRRVARGRARQTLARLEVGRHADCDLSGLTLAERVRVSLALALVREPRLLLIDEPPVLGSPSESDALFALLRSLVEEPGMAVVIASEQLIPLEGARRQMAISHGEVRSMDAPGVVVEFPGRRAAAGGGGR